MFKVYIFTNSLVKNFVSKQPYENVKTISFFQTLRKTSKPVRVYSDWIAIDCWIRNSNVVISVRILIATVSNQIQFTYHTIKLNRDLF